MRSSSPLGSREQRAVLLVRPVNWRVVAVLAGIVPAHAVVVECTALGPYGKRELVRIDRMADRGPYLTALVHARKRLYRHFQDIRNLRRALLTIYLIFDRRLLRTEIIADQWHECRHRTAG